MNKELNIRESIYKTLLFLKRHLILLIIFIIIGSITSFFITKKHQEYYKTELYLESTLLSPEEINYLSLDLSKYVKYRQIDSLAKLLETNTTNIDDLKSINYRVLNDSVFMLKIRSYNITHLEKTKDFILKYYNSSNNAKKKIRQLDYVTDSNNMQVVSQIDSAITTKTEKKYVENIIIWILGSIFIGIITSLLIDQKIWIR